MQVKEKVFVLKTIKYGESDIILHCLGAESGLVNLIAKGALKSRKRFGGGVLEPTHYIMASYRKKSDNDDALHFLQEASLLDGFDGLRANYERLETALYFLSLIGKVSQQGDQDAGLLFNLLGNALKALLKTADLGRLRMHFEAKLLGQQGVLPPDLPKSDIFNCSILDHQTIDISQREYQLLKNRIHLALNQYLN